MIREPLCREQGLLAGMSARTRLLSAGVCLVSVSAVQGLGPALILALFALALALAAGIRLKTVLLRLVPANVFFLVLALVLALTYPGPTLAGAAFFSLDGLEKALRIALKGNSLLLVFMALVCTTPVPALSRALQDLGAPRKLTVLFALTHRQVFLVHEEFQRLHRAALARCFSPGLSLHVLKTYAVLFGQTLLRSLSRAERIQGAMHLRGFAGRFHVLSPPAPARRDAAAAVMLCAGPLLVFLFDRLFDRWPI